MPYSAGSKPPYLRLTIAVSLAAAAAILVVVAMWLAVPRPSRVMDATKAVAAERDSVFSRADYERASKRFLAFGTLQTGDSGKIPASRIRVDQVVDESAFIARTTVDYGNRQNADMREVTMWISGFPTNGLVDGVGVPVPGPFKVIGTKTYGTALGSQRTIWHLSPMSLPPAE